METYVVRIYRKKGSEKRRHLAGVVEKVAAEETRAFKTKDELWRILCQDETGGKIIAGHSHEENEQLHRDRCRLSKP